MEREILKLVDDFGRGRCFAAACDLYPDNLNVKERREKANELQLLLIDVGESTVLEFDGGRAKVDCLPYGEKGERGYLKIEVHINTARSELGDVSIVLPPDSGAKARIGKVVVDPMYVGKKAKIEGSSIIFVDANRVK